MKRFISIFLTVFLLAGLLTVPAAAASDSCGESLTWSFDKETATLTISGSGPMDDFTYASVPWILYRLAIQHIIVEDGVTSIGNNAFNTCTAAVDVSLPKELTAIGNNAFFGCSALETITFPEGLATIGSFAFSYCSGLTEITLPDSVKTVGTKAFAACKELTSIQLSAGLEAIENEAFTDCIALTTVTIPESVTKIGQYTFANCEALAEITLPDTLTSIGSGAFSGCSSLQTITLPHSLDTLGSWAFHRCTALESAALPASLTTVPSNCFSQCSALQSITLHAETVVIDPFAFSQCAALTDVYYTGTRAQFAALDVAAGNTALTDADLHPTILCKHQLTTLEGTPANCTAAGLSEGSRCDLCGEDIVQQTIIAPVGHVDEDSDYRCDVCQTNLCTIHIPEVVPAKPATCTQAGKTEGSRCSRCGRTLTLQSSIPALPHEYVDGVCTVCGAEEPVVLPTENPFTDVAEDAYYYNAVLWAVDKPITTGITDTTFCPDAICNRAQAVTFLYRAAGEPAVADAENPFSDVAEDAYYYNAVLWAVANGITTGTSDTTFSPDSSCSRSQIVTFLYRAADKPAAEAENPFSDVAEDAYYYNAVLWAVANGITTGTSDTAFSPDSNCTRSQIVTFLYRAMA